MYILCFIIGYLYRRGKKTFESGKSPQVYQSVRVDHQNLGLFKTAGQY